MARIVYIEDHAELREEIAAALCDQGFEVAEAADGETGLALIAKLRPDLVLCDIAMPGLDGGTVLRRLRRDHPDLARMPFVFLTALADRAQIIAGKELGADDYLTKPVDLELLIATIQSRLDQIARIDRHVADERTVLLDRMSRESQLSFLSAADVLNHVRAGVVLLDAAGQVVYVNHAARLMIEADDGLSLSRIGLGGTTPKGTAGLRGLIAAVVARDGEAGPQDNVMTLERPSGRRPYQIMVSALTGRPAEGDGPRPAAVAFIHDPDGDAGLSPERLSRLHGLSLAEARVVADLARGLSPEDIAEVQGVSRSTIATHLSRSFAKTATAGQRELLALVLRGAGLAPAEG